MDKTLHHHMCLLNHHPPFNPPVLILLSSPLAHNAEDVNLSLGSVRNAIYSILKPGGQRGGQSSEELWWCKVLSINRRL